MGKKPEKKAKEPKVVSQDVNNRGFFSSIVVKSSIAMAIALLVIGLVISFSSINQFSAEIVRNSEESVELVASETANFLNEKIMVYMRYIDGLSHEYSVYADHLGMKDKLGEYAADVGLGDIGYADKNGDTWTASKELVSIASRPYYQKAMQGEWNISDVVIDPTSGKPIMMLAIPLVKAGTISGVMYARNSADFLSQFVVDAKYGENGVTFIINQDGVIMAHPDTSFVEEGKNIFDAAEGDSTAASFVEVMKRATTEEKGFATCTLGGTERYIGYAMLPDFGWRVIVMADSTDVLAGQRKVTTTSLILTLAFIIIGMLFAYFLLRRLLSPLKGIEREMKRISTGDLSKTIDVKLVSKKDEMASLVDSLKAMQDNLKSITEDVKVSAVELDNKSNELNQISRSSQTAISQINNAIEDIAKGSSSQAQDTSNAMANIEELNSSMDTIQQEAEELFAKAEATKVISENAKTIMGELLDISEMTKQRIGDIVQQSEANVEATKSIESIIDSSDRAAYILCGCGNNIYVFYNLI
ncbi:MAG: methyl-accepting chemotaxis protein, partial [Lachnospiraceae bacterium]|nr:methyl-accepting chemotaxis protein [Lachnospiraceae bacterium]